MKTLNSVLINQAKESLKGKWMLAIGGYLVYYFTATVPSLFPRIGSVAILIIGGPLFLGLHSFFLSIARNQEAKIDQIFIGFKSFGKALGAYLLMFLYIILWTFVFIIPGIVAALSYSMAFYILVDEPTIGVSDALKKSKQLMQGNVGKYLKLLLPFIAIPLLLVIINLGFIISATIHHDFLSITRYSALSSTSKGKLITSSFVVLFSGVFVWMYVASAKFYDDIKSKEVTAELEG